MMKRIHVVGTTTTTTTTIGRTTRQQPQRLLFLLLTTPAILLSSSSSVVSACTFEYNMDCFGGYPYKAVNSLTIDSSGSYEAHVIYHWTKANTDLGTISLSGTEILDNASFDYEEEGVYYAGATIIWGSGSGCEGSSSDSFSKITFSEDWCDMENGVTPPDNVMTLEPSGGEEGSGSTESPTSGEAQSESTDPPSTQPPPPPPPPPPPTPPPTVKKVVVTPSPTTRRPITNSPSLRPVFVPDTNTLSPTDKVTQNIFSKAPISSSSSSDAPTPTTTSELQIIPTSPPFTDVIECGNGECQSSENSIVCAPDCTGVELQSPDIISNDVATITQSGVYFTIESTRDIIVTGMELYPGSSGSNGFEHGITVYARHGEVGYDALMANENNIIYSTTNSLSGSDETGGVKISLDLPMLEDTLTSIYILDGGDSGGSSTRSSGGGIQCLTRLGEGNVGDGTLLIFGGTGVEENSVVPAQFMGTLRYDVVKSLTPYPTMAPNTEDETTSPSVGGPNPSSATVDQPTSNNSNNNSTTTVIAAGATAGICAMVLTLAIGMYLVRKKKRESSYRSKGGGSTTQDLTPDRVGLEIETHSETLYQQQQQQPSQSYFGTIHKKEGEVDDISTLGDPYMGDAVVNRMDADNTVGESMVSNQQQLYIYGVGKPGANIGTASRMGESTVFSGSKVMMFGEDTALEDIYQTPTPNGDSTLDLITVLAPAGPLGIVLDNPHGALPYVYAIKETSSLNGRVRVGDLLLSVDEVDCRGMSSHTITRFLSSRSTNPERKLVLARGTGMDHDGSTASAV